MLFNPTSAGWSATYKNVLSQRVQILCFFNLLQLIKIGAHIFHTVIISISEQNQCSKKEQADWLSMSHPFLVSMITTTVVDIF